MATCASPHKEERFLPIYPISCLGAVFTVDLLNAIGRMEAAVSRHKELAVRHVSG
jgi:hypothetical protein